MTNLKNNKEYQIELEKKKKIKKNITIVIGVIMVFEIANIIYNVLYQFDAIKNSNWYLNHAGIPISILFVGVIALLLPIVNKYSSIRSSNHNDKYITIGGIVLIAAAFVMFIGSFM